MGADELVMKAFFEEAPRSMYPKYIFIESDEGLDLARKDIRILPRAKTPYMNLLRYELIEEKLK